MDKVLIFLIFSLFFSLAISPYLKVCAAAQTIPPFGDIADAIYKAEGSEKASRPYGILSVHCDTPDECRRVCLNTIRNNYHRWLKSDQSISFIKFLGLRYCPPSVDPVGHKNWIKNVNYFLGVR